MSGTELAVTEGNHIPEAVRRQAMMAEESFARAYGDTAAPDTTVVEPVTEPAAAAPVVVPPPENFEQKYLTLQGKYNAEVPGLRAEIAGLQRAITALQAAAPVAPAPAPTTTVVEPSVFDPKDVEEFGEDLLKTIERRAEAKMMPYLKQLEEKVKQLTGSTEQVKQSLSQDAVMKVLDNDSVLGNQWRVINTDPAFLAWLAQVDPFTGDQRSLMLRNAYDRGDAGRTANFFRAYLKEHTVVDPASAGQADQTTPVVADGPSLESLVAPGRGTGPAPAGAPAEQRIWTQQNIAAFYRDVQKGVFVKGREAERLRLEQDIFAAGREGRIR